MPATSAVNHEPRRGEPTQRPDTEGLSVEDQTSRCMPPMFVRHIRNGMLITQQCDIRSHKRRPR